MRSSKRGHPLTIEEARYVGQTAHEEGRPRCPDCGRPLCRGPSGGVSINWGCACGSQFNCTIFSTGPGECVAMGDRLYDAGPRDLGERGFLYGLPAERPVTPGPAPETGP